MSSLARAQEVPERIQEYVVVDRPVGLIGRKICTVVESDKVLKVKAEVRRGKKVESFTQCEIPVKNDDEKRFLKSRIVAFLSRRYVCYRIATGRIGCDYLLKLVDKKKK